MASPYASRIAGKDSGEPAPRLVGIGAGLLAAVVRAIEAAGLQRARSAGTLWAHAFGNVLAMIVCFGNLKLRWEAEGVWVTAGPYLSAVVSALILISDWLGGSLSFQHGIGVSSRIGSPEPNPDPDRTPTGTPDVAIER